jgi:hypothetical protein
MTPYDSNVGTGPIMRKFRSSSLTCVLVSQALIPLVATCIIAVVIGLCLGPRKL